MASHGVPRSSSTLSRSAKAREKELQTIKEYQGLVDQLQEKVDAREYTPAVLRLTSQLLKLNPEYYTVWNQRRRILLEQFSPTELPRSSASHIATTPVDPSESVSEATVSARDEQSETLIRSDLAFLLPLLITYPKCYWIWNHRIWLLQQATLRLPPGTSRPIWLEELGLVLKMLVRDNRNFHGWGYRCFVVQNLDALPHDGPPLSEGDKPPKSMVEQEFLYTTKMISANLSNFSAWHQRSRLAPLLLSQRNADHEARREFLDREFETSLEALYTDPFNESVWVYHAWLISTLVPSSAHLEPIVSLSPDESSKEINRQVEALKELLELESECKHIYAALIRYTTFSPAQTVRWEAEIKGWMTELVRLDPLRKMRWEDLLSSTFGH